MITDYDERQLDALRELASIGSGTAATALAQLLGRPVELAVPRVLALPLADALDAVGEPDAMVASVVMPTTGCAGGARGDAEIVVLLLFSYRCAATLCELLCVEPRSELGDSALGEIGNILGASAVGALATMTGLALEPQPPHVLYDMLGAVVASVLSATAGELDSALVLDAELAVADAACGLSFLLLPTAVGVAELLGRLGLGAEE
ncbi:MAG TPA: chemotaxis protein CheC [Conexibacter sp.]|jgi:chemotaxis protein CheC|nr:chemotaxis protein CheC [Conexibacter sp.]